MKSKPKPSNVLNISYTALRTSPVAVIMLITQEKKILQPTIHNRPVDGLLRTPRDVVRYCVKNNLIPADTIRGIAAALVRPTANFFTGHLA